MNEVKRFNGMLIFTGVLLIILGIMCLAWHTASLVTLTVIAGITFLVAGIVELATYFSYRGVMIYGGWIVFDAITYIALALFCFFEPIATGVAFVWVCAFLVIAAGCMLFYPAFAARRAGMEGWWVLLVAAILSVVFGILLISHPALFIILVGILAIIRGIQVIAGGVGFNRLIEG